MKLEDVGFYTLSDQRAAQASVTSPLWRAELLLTGRCNFRCPYCRQVGSADLAPSVAREILNLWTTDRLQCVRFSGGEPTLHPSLRDLVAQAKDAGVTRIAISTNGSANPDVYEELMAAGVNDFSISLDACCAGDGDRMAGGIEGAWGRTVATIDRLARRVYLTVGVVLTQSNLQQTTRIIQFAHDLGVDDIRIIPAAQESDLTLALDVPLDVLAAHPILRFRVSGLKRGIPLRGIRRDDSNRCGLVLDDMAVLGDRHYPCIIYLREGGRPIGTVGPGMRQERERWWRQQHNTHRDPICSTNCLDVCVLYNNRHAATH